MSLAAFEDPMAFDGPSPAPVLDIIPRRAGEDIGGDQRERLVLVPEHVLAPLPRRRLSTIATGLTAAVLIHGGFAGLLLLLLDWRDLAIPPETTIPVEIVSAMPKPPAPKTVAENVAPRPDMASPPATSDSPARPELSAPPPPPVVAPPPEAARAATQPVENKPVDPAPDVSQLDRSPPAPPPKAPAVLSAGEGSFAVAPKVPANPDPAPAPEPNTPKPKAAPLPSLVTALPMSSSALPSSFRAFLSGEGSQQSEEYKGLVFGRIGRSHQAVERARARHLRGHVVVSFGIDGQGHAMDLKIAVSSGNAALDALGLDMVREAEPFPPPPPGGKSVFTPAFAFGEE